MRNTDVKRKSAGTRRGGADICRIDVLLLEIKKRALLYIGLDVDTAVCAKPCSMIAPNETTKETYLLACSSPTDRPLTSYALVQP